MDASARVVSSSQRPLYQQDKQQTQEMNIRAVSGARTRDSSNIAAADLRITPHGYRDRLIFLLPHIDC